MPIGLRVLGHDGSQAEGMAGGVEHHDPAIIELLGRQDRPARLRVLCERVEVIPSARELNSASTQNVLCSGGSCASPDMVVIPPSSGIASVRTAMA